MTTEFDRRSFLTRSAAVAAGLAVAGDLAVPGLAGATLTHGHGRNGLATAKPKHGGDLVIGVDAEESGFNPSSGHYDAVGFLYARTVFDPLMAVTATGKVVPYLAESLVPNADYTVWTITLRPDVMFHDGKPCNGAALLQNVDVQYKSLLVGLALKPLVASYDQTGELSVAITMKNPWVTFPYTLAEQQICFVAAPSMLEAKNGGTNMPVGTGPFKFKEWVVNDHFTATANPNYWRKGLPYLNSITYKPITSDQSRVDALQSGTISMLHCSAPQQILSLRSDSGLSYVDNSGKMIGTPDTRCLMLNVSQPPFNLPDARLAMVKAANQAQVAKVIDQGVNAPSNGLYYPGSPYYEADDGYPSYNLSEAKALVKKVEKQLGAPFEFTVNAVAAPETTRLAEYLQGIAANVGVKVTIANMLQNELVDDALLGKFQASEFSNFGAISPDLNYIWFSTTTVSDTGPSINMARNSDPRIEQALLTGMQTTSTATRIEAFKNVNRYLCEDLPYVWVDRATWAIASSTKVQNWAGGKAPGGAPLLANNQGVWWPTQIFMS